MKSAGPTSPNVGHYVSVHRPDDPFERARVDAKLDALGLPKHRERNQISEEEARDLIEGGVDAVRRAAALTGKTDRLEVSDLMALRPKAQPGLLRFLGEERIRRKEEAKHVRSAQTATELLETTARLLDGAKPLFQQLYFSPAVGDFIQQARFHFQSLSEALENALRPENLAAASETSTAALRQAMARFSEQIWMLRDFKVSVFRESDGPMELVRALSEMDQRIATLTGETSRGAIRVTALDEWAPPYETVFAISFASAPRPRPKDETVQIVGPGGARFIHEGGSNRLSVLF